jgi:hypothetical protein
MVALEGRWTFHAMIPLWEATVRETAACGTRPPRDRGCRQIPLI